MDIAHILRHFKDTQVVISDLTSPILSDSADNNRADRLAEY
jgi:hypothetical protein